MFLSTADLQPVSRESMRGLRAKREELRRQEEEARRLAHVTNLVREIYQRATMIASITDRTHYVYSMKGMEVAMTQELAEGLRPLFPGCSVSLVNKEEDVTEVVVDWR